MARDMGKGRQWRILVVEDDYDQAQLIKIRLGQFDPTIEVLIASTGEQGLDLLRHEPFQLVTLDYNLPIRNGLEVLRDIRSTGIDIPVVMVTGEGDEMTAVAAMREGANDYVIKDKSFPVILPRIVANAIDKHALETRYRNIFGNASDAIFIVDGQTGRLIEANRRALSLTGYSLEELLDLHSEDLYAADDQPKIARLDKETLDVGEKTYGSLGIRTRGGEIIPVEIRATAISLGHKEVILKIARDVRETKKLELQILASKKRLQSVFDSITDIISLQDEDLTIRMANRKFAQERDIDPGEIIGKKCYATYFGRPTPCPNCPVQATFQSQQPEFVELHEKGDIVHIWSYPIFGLDGTLESVVEYARYVTEQKNLEKKLLQSEKMASLGLLAAGIAHELRNPLNIIESARYLVSKEIKQDHAGAIEKLEIIRNQVRRASKIINDLLHFSRSSKEEQEHIDVNSLVTATFSLIQKELRSSNIRLATNLPDNLPGPFVSADAVKQVFLNVIINAVHAMPKGGNLDIRTEDRGEWLAVVVQDTGCGIPKENLDKIFDPMFTTKEPGEGTGLGLYVSHMMVTREGGEILVESTPGVGTTITILLPLSKKEHKAVTSGDIRVVGAVEDEQPTEGYVAV